MVMQSKGELVFAVCSGVRAVQEEEDGDGDDGLKREDGGEPPSVCVCVYEREQ